MGTIIVENAVERKPGYLYYIDGEGNLCEAELARRKKDSIKKKSFLEIIKKNSEEK